MISVIIPVYNGAEFLKEAVDSVIQQNIKDIEIQMVDDGSTDNTKEVIMSLPYDCIHYSYQENKGASAARNTGLRKAKYDFITFLDCDDVWPAGKLQRQMDIFKDNPQLKVVGGLIDYFYMAGSEYRKSDFKVDQPVFNVQLGALMIRKEVIETIGYFDEQIVYAEDQDWLMRIREKKIPVQIFDEVMLRYRIHTGNSTIQKSFKELNILKALKLSLDRRRKAGLDSLGSIDELWTKK